VADPWAGGQPAVLCSVSGTEGSQCTVLSRKGAWNGTRSELLVSSRAVTLMPISGISLSIAALPGLDHAPQKPFHADRTPGASGALLVKPPIERVQATRQDWTRYGSR